MLLVADPRNIHELCGSQSLQFPLHGPNPSVGKAHDFVGIIAAARIAEQQAQYPALGLGKESIRHTGLFLRSHFGNDSSQNGYRQPHEVPGLFIALGSVAQPIGHGSLGLSGAQALSSGGYFHVTTDSSRNWRGRFGASLSPPLLTRHHRHHPRNLQESRLLQQHQLCPRSVRW